MKSFNTFEVNGVQYQVAPLCQAQEDILLEIFGEIGVVDMAVDLAMRDEETEIKLDQVLINLGRKRLIPRFLATVLVPVNQKFDETNLEKVISDVAAAPSDLKFRVWPDFLAAAGNYRQHLTRIFPQLKTLKLGKLMKMGATPKASSTTSAKGTSASASKSVTKH